MSAVTASIATPEGSFSGYLARPGLDGTGPGIVVIQEIFGVNTEMRRICDGLAQQGFVALCPDLFWRQEPNVVLTDNTEQEWGRAFELMQGFDADKGVDDIAASIAFLRGHDACTGKVGALGFCLGGKMAYMTAARTDADCSISYYGVGIQDMLGEAGNIAKPLMLHVAGKDQFVPPEAQDAIRSGLEGHAQTTLHVYPECDHAFARVGGQHYDADAAATARERSLSFLNEHLR